jgi:hypothetical protein
MPLEEILTLLHTRPFVPFRVHLLDGVAYDVHHRALLMPGARSVIIGLNADPQLPYYEPGRHVIASLLAISRLEPLRDVSAPGNGQTGT